MQLRAPKHLLTTKNARGNFLTTKSAKNNFGILGRGTSPGGPGNPAGAGSLGNPGPQTPDPSHRLLWDPVRTPLGKPNWGKNKTPQNNPTNTQASPLQPKNNTHFLHFSFAACPVTSPKRLSQAALAFKASYLRYVCCYRS